MRLFEKRFALPAVAAVLVACGGGPRPTVTPVAHPSAAVRQLERDIARLVGAPALQRSIWGVLVRSLTRNDTLYSLNAHKLLMPASNMKIVTLAAAAERLGWDFSYETRLIAAGAIEDGVLNGDLLVVGTGDPSVDDWDGQATRLFGDWAEQLKACGVRVIAGRVVGDDNWFEDQFLGSGWAWDDLDKGFATSVGALQFNENTAQVTIEPGVASAEPARVASASHGSGLVIRNLVRTGEAGSVALVETRRAVGTAVLELRGSIPLGAAPIVRNVSAYNPTLYFVTTLRDRLIGAGIDVRGEAMDIDDLAEPPPRESGTLLVSHRSPPLSDLAQTMMKLSQNLFAESLMNAVGASDSTSVDGGTNDGLGTVRTILQAWNIPASSVVVADGSGLSRYNLATPDALVTILTHVYHDDRLRDPFEAALPIAGQDGTLAQRMKGTVAQGNARAKTGAFSNARAVSGYVRTADGEPLVFSIIANNFGSTGDVVEETTDALVVRLAEFSRR